MCSVLENEKLHGLRVLIALVDVVYGPKRQKREIGDGGSCP